MSFIGLALLLVSVGVAVADDTDVDADYSWRFHNPPFDFKFGNMIDSHQQSMIVDGGNLQGFLYIHFTGDYTDGDYPIAEKAHCPTQECNVGWILKGVPISATLLQKGPRIWLVDPADLPQLPGYTHFQWLGDPHSPHDLVIGQEYPGMLLRRVAPTPFFWLGGSGSGGGGGGGCGGGGGSDPGGGGGGCSGGGDSGGCSGDDGGCSGGDSGGCSGDDGGCSGDETGGCSGDDGGCSGDETGGCSGDDGGCSGGGSGGCDGETGGCSGGCSGGGGHGSGGHGGRLVPEGIDPHSNIVTDPADVGSGGGGSCGGCSGDDGGCNGDGA